MYQSPLDGCTSEDNINNNIAAAHRRTTRRAITALTCGFFDGQDIGSVIILAEGQLQVLTRSSNPTQAELLESAMTVVAPSSLIGEVGYCPRVMVLLHIPGDRDMP